MFFLLYLSLIAAEDAMRHHHHHHHHHKHHHHKHAAQEEPAAVAPPDENEVAQITSPEETTPEGTPENVPQQKEGDTGPSPPATEEDILRKMKKLEDELKKKEEELKNKTATGQINVNGPLEADFNDVFAKSVAKATGCDAKVVRVVGTKVVSSTPSFIQAEHIVEVTFEAPQAVVKEVETQAADPNSALTTGALEEFLVAKDEDPAVYQEKPTPVKEKGIDIDTDMPYGELEPFGREDTAQELTEQSINESDEMVDQMERAEVAEERRAVFRALTRLRGLAITSFDGVARAQTGNIDEYNKINKWRKTHMLRHLATEESDIPKWAFPENAD